MGQQTPHLLYVVSVSFNSNDCIGFKLSLIPPSSPLLSSFAIPEKLLDNVWKSVSIPHNLFPSFLLSLLLIFLRTIKFECRACHREWEFNKLHDTRPTTNTLRAFFVCVLSLTQIAKKYEWDHLCLIKITWPFSLFVWHRVVIVSLTLTWNQLSGWWKSSWNLPWSLLRSSWEAEVKLTKKRNIRIKNGHKIKIDHRGSAGTDYFPWNMRGPKKHGRKIDGRRDVAAGGYTHEKMKNAWNFSHHLTTWQRDSGSRWCAG